MSTILLGDDRVKDTGNGSLDMLGVYTQPVATFRNVIMELKPRTEAGRLAIQLKVLTFTRRHIGNDNPEGANGRLWQERDHCDSRALGTDNREVRIVRMDLRRVVWRELATSGGQGATSASGPFLSSA